MLANFSNEILTIPKATILGITGKVSENLVDKINPGMGTNLNEQTKPPRKRKNEALCDKLLRGKLDQLSQEERQQTELLLLKWGHVFHEEETNDFKATSVVQHQIPIGDTQPIRKPIYGNPYALRVEMHGQVQKMLDRDIIPYPTAFPYGNGMVLHFYQQQESSTTKTVHKVINKGLKTYV